MSSLKAIAAIAAVLVLSRCAPLPGPAPSAAVDPLAHEQRLRALEHWHLQAKAGLRSPGQNGSARLSWQQAPQHFFISLSGPLGQGRVTLNGTPAGVTLTQAGAPTQHAASARQLLQQHTGWDLPINLLTDWLLGLPALTQPVEQLTRTDNGLLKTLQQAGWQLSYSRYQAVGEVFLPSKIIATRTLNPTQSIRLVIAVHHWQTGPSATDQRSIDQRPTDRAPAGSPPP
jgi:outer membrane lipoprotein LolB